jgi:hypothetical protein
MDHLTSHPQPVAVPTQSRRALLRTALGAVGATGFAATGLGQDLPEFVNPLAPRAPHIAPKANRGVFLYM